MENKYHISSIPRKFELIANQIVDYILSDHIDEGEKLPTERQLGELLNVSRSSIREGIRVLELFNYLDSRQGGGTFVSKPYPFLIPYQILEQSINADIQKNYYEIGLSIAKSIIEISIKKDVFISSDLNINVNQSFWQGFWSIIDYLGKKIDNSFYHYLASNIYSLIVRQGLPKADSLDIHDLMTAFNQRDSKVIDDYFQLLFGLINNGTLD